jgi:hypothetical protein
MRSKGKLLFARAILADKFGSVFAVAAKEGTSIVDPIIRILIHLTISRMFH